MTSLAEEIGMQVCLLRDRVLYSFSRLLKKQRKWFVDISNVIAMFVCGMYIYLY